MTTVRKILEDPYRALDELGALDELEYRIAEVATTIGVAHILLLRGRLDPTDAKDLERTAPLDIIIDFELTSEGEPYTGPELRTSELQRLLQTCQSNHEHDEHEIGVYRDRLEETIALMKTSENTQLSTAITELLTTVRAIVLEDSRSLSEDAGRAEYALSVVQRALDSFNEGHSQERLDAATTGLIVEYDRRVNELESVLGQKKNELERTGRDLGVCESENDRMRDFYASEVQERENDVVRRIIATARNDFDSVPDTNQEQRRVSLEKTLYVINVIKRTMGHV
jgi:hypothetical protein